MTPPLGTSVWSHTYLDTQITDGLYSLTLAGPFDSNDFNGDRWVGISIDGGVEITPRTSVASVPFALNAAAAQSVDWGDIDNMPAGFEDGTDPLAGSGAPASNGAAGRVSVFDTTTSVAGASGLLYANNTLTATGDLKLSGSISQSTSLAARVYHNANQSIPHNRDVALEFNSERFDSNFFHDTSLTALQGTVSKTNGSSTLTGTGTNFDGQLYPGQLISIPGGTTEKRWIMAIASDTSLTVSSNFASSASGQTASIVNSTRLVCKTPGRYLITGAAWIQANGTGLRALAIWVNGNTRILQVDQDAAATSGMPTQMSVSTVYDLAVNDYVELFAYQFTSSGTFLTVNYSANSSPEFSMVRLP